VQDNGLRLPDAVVKRWSVDGLSGTGKRGACTGSRKQQPGSARELKLLLTDLQMPQMDGFEVIATHREIERPEAGHLPIIAMTAHAMEGDRERCLAAGMDGYISKPFQIDELLKVIENLPQLISSST